MCLIYHICVMKHGSWDGIVRIVTVLQAGQSGIWILAAAGDLSLLWNIHTGSVVHPASYSIGTGPSFPGSKANRV
jgi:hypothetical protein